jgi:1,4-dihydroxy-2-naphthoyl-CoA hydrolase
VADEQGQELQSPFDKLLGLRIQEASGDRVVAVLPVTPDLHQPTGLVHGGVYATVVETTASVGATLWLAGRGQAFGISNHTDFLRPVREGDLRVEATPLSRGRTTQLWQVSVTDERGRGVAHGKVRLFNSEQVPGSAGRA